MQTLKSMPKVLEKMEDLHKLSNSNTDQLLTEYKRNVKQFIQSLTKEVLQLIDKYESKINQLVEENQRLRKAQRLFESLSPIKRLNRSPKRVGSSTKSFTCIDINQAAKSSGFGSNCLNKISNNALLSNMLGKYRKTQNEDNHFPIELISGNHEDSGEVIQRKSRFLAKSNVKKQKEEQLCHYLQTRGKNLQKTTKQLMIVLGRKNKPEENQEQLDDLQLNHEIQESSIQLKKFDSNLNKSLGDICQSLDTSFHSKKARSKNAKKREQIQQEIKKKQHQDQEVVKLIKDRGVKNLLHKLRDNVQNSKNPPEIIKNAKIISLQKSKGKSKRVSREKIESSPLSNRRN